ncbi:DUF2905 domain-containing protein [Nitrospirales bacterium NOB]|nr:MAG: hypothetical protein UZ03_NOB001001196 [Nitrospira sp. OLB3]MBV6468827.1 hypothetical protein [Nitrospirota bacterium]MCE7964159.1 DUF2905 domain-containing protein [Nitrospira sp. NTP2]MCK6500259.1 DUF2905 domain-containing protein [Nitrospira sp.]MDL1888002.1 DUF2905 domain-containing protein [Nitrospirales bacterium NOB]
MSMWSDVGRWFVVLGLALAAVGVLLTLADKWVGLGSLLGWFGKLPGDLSFKRDQFSVYIPLATSLILSILLSFLFSILSWLFRR